MDQLKLCPLMEEAIDDGTCFVIHTVVEGITPLSVVPKKVQENEKRAEICNSCPHHRND